MPCFSVRCRSSWSQKVEEVQEFRLTNSRAVGKSSDPAREYWDASDAKRWRILFGDRRKVEGGVWPARGDSLCVLFGFNIQDVFGLPTITILNFPSRKKRPPAGLNMHRHNSALSSVLTGIPYSSAALKTFQKLVFCRLKSERTWRGNGGWRSRRKIRALFRKCFLSVTPGSPTVFTCFVGECIERQRIRRKIINNN